MHFGPIIIIIVLYFFFVSDCSCLKHGTIKSIGEEAYFTWNHSPFGKFFLLDTHGILLSLIRLNDECIVTQLICLDIKSLFLSLSLSDNQEK